MNCDETSWKLYSNGILTWVQTGNENISIEIKDDEKATIIAMATINTHGKMFPLYLIAKGKIKQIDIPQLGDIGIHKSDHSPAGWPNVDVMKYCLRSLNRTPEFDEIEGSIHLIMDTDRAHIAAAVKKLASELGFRTHFIPPGFTDRYQPLDRRVFDFLKAT
jgi:hypothetical protein